MISKIKAEKALSNVVKKLGVSKEQALFNSTSVTLREELLLWDRASGGDFLAFEKRI